MSDVIRIAQYYSYVLDWRFLLITLFFFALSILVGVILYHLCQPFISTRQRWGKPLLILTMGLSSSMVIWVGDPNLLYTFPVFLFFFMLATKGNRLGRLAMCIIFFCLIMSICALLDTYLGYRLIHLDTDYLTSFGRLFLAGMIYLCFRRFLPKRSVQLSPNLWALVFALSLMPLCALAATVLLTYPYNYESALMQEMILRQGIAILPFVLITSLVLLAAVIILARQEALEQEHALAAQRDIYYEGLRQQDQQLRQLRHDLRNHITAASGLLELGKLDEARAYLDALGDSKALSRPRRFCDNDTVNVVLAAKADAIEQAGLVSDFQAALPASLPIADTDLCALFGNALDNAREGALGCPDATVRLRCRYDKGMLMLAVDNPISGDVLPDLRTTKADKEAHGHGLPGMRSIADRYGGSLETRIDDNGFHLLVCLSPENNHQ